LLTVQAQFLAQSFDTPNPSREPVRTQFGLQPFQPIGLSGAHMGGLDRHFQPRILLRSF
jgi:hypothetical protein